MTAVNEDAGGIVQPPWRAYNDRLMSGTCARLCGAGAIMEGCEA